MEPTQMLQEKAGCLRLMGRLFWAPPDLPVLKDAETLEFIKPGYNLETLQIEFTQLFSLPGKNAICPYQSVYTDVLELEVSKDPLECGLSFAGGTFPGYLGGKSIAELNHWYAAVGFKPQDASPAMLEHVSTQLEFVAHLYLLQAQAIESKSEADAAALEALRTDFIAQFLGRWIKTFANKVAQNKISHFYGGVGKCLFTAFPHLS